TARGKVAHSTQMQALSALLFLYRDVLRRPLGDLRGLIRASGARRLPTALSRREVAQVLDRLQGDGRLGALLRSGAGLRLDEALTLRIKGLDFERGEIRVRRGKGGKDRVTMLPASASGQLREHLDRVKRLHERDRASGA